MCFRSTALQYSLVISCYSVSLNRGVLCTNYMFLYALILILPCAFVFLSKKSCRFKCWCWRNYLEKLFSIYSFYYFLLFMFSERSCSFGNDSSLCMKETAVGWRLENPCTKNCSLQSHHFVVKGAPFIAMWFLVWIMLEPLSC